jgi:hypothetical protein
VSVGGRQFPIGGTHPDHFDPRRFDFSADLTGLLNDDEPKGSSARASVIAASALQSRRRRSDV